MADRIKGSYTLQDMLLRRYLDPKTGRLHLDKDSVGYVSARWKKLENGTWYKDGYIFYPDSAQPGIVTDKLAVLTPPTGYPDGNPKTLQGAKKHTMRYSPTVAVLAMNRAFADGAVKYGPANWREKGVTASVYIDAAMRHMALYFDGGEEVASDSGVEHLGHAMACLAILLDAKAAGKLNDDRPTPMPNLEALLKRS